LEQHDFVPIELGTYNYRAALPGGVKLQRRLNRVVDGVTYEKWVVTLPPDVVAAAKLKEGAELEALPYKGGIKLIARLKSKRARRKAN
jgi:hypothetical protein